MQMLKDNGSIKLERNFEMPSVPIVLARILQLVDDNRASAHRLEELILHDPPLTARILKLANSALYSFRSEVRSISHAVTLLGLNLVKSLAIGVSIFESFTKGLRDEAGCISQLWMHSFAVGMMSQEIWSKRSNKTAGEFALLCGLLHDLGMVYYFKHDFAGYSKLFGGQKGEQDPDICFMESRQYGVDHTSVGFQIARHWNLPPDLGVVIRQHHSILSEAPLVAAVSMADMLVKQAGIGFDGDHRVTADMPNLQRLLKMNQPEFDFMCALARDRRTDVEEFFKLTS